MPRLSQMFKEIHFLWWPCTESNTFSWIIFYFIFFFATQQKSRILRKQLNNKEIWKNPEKYHPLDKSVKNPSPCYKSLSIVKGQKKSFLQGFFVLIKLKDKTVTKYILILFHVYHLIEHN